MMPEDNSSSSSSSSNSKDGGGGSSSSSSMSLSRKPKSKAVKAARVSNKSKGGSSLTGNVKKKAEEEAKARGDAEARARAAKAEDSAVLEKIKPSKAANASKAGKRASVSSVTGHGKKRKLETDAGPDDSSTAADESRSVEGAQKRERRAAKPSWKAQESRDN